jgi:hemerythrin-like domain-containing protein
MKYASEDLVKEHDGILTALDILESMVSRLKRNQVVEEEHLKEIVNFLKVFADKCHHGKEEGLLFPAMEKYGIPRENGPVGQMLREHVEGRQYISDMTEALQAAGINRDDFMAAALNYIGLLRNHIEKENSILFPLGDNRIPIDIQKDLLISFENFEKEVMGEGVHERFHALLDNFENIYLNKRE